MENKARTTGKTLAPVLANSAVRHGKDFFAVQQTDNARQR
jgi:hypothetical protein